MAIEIERKFLVTGTLWRQQVSSSRTIVQGYLTSNISPSVRVRLDGDKACITIKTGSDPLHRLEFEYAIPVADCMSLLEAANDGIVEKCRHIIDTGSNLTWEIDEFHGLLSGLIIAEIEIPNAESEFVLPSWVGREVTNDPYFLNANLVRLEKTPVL